MAFLDTPGTYENEIKRGVLHLRSARLDALVAAVNLFVKSPRLTRLLDVRDKLDAWKATDPREFADRGKNSEAALRHEIHTLLHNWGEGEIGLVNPDDHPSWEPAKWNDNGTIQLSTNCYAYACNDPYFHSTGQKPQPGQLGNSRLTSAEHSAVRYAVMRDDLQRNAQQLQRLVPLIRLRDEAVPDHVINVKGYYLIALVTAPGADYHWVRQDDDGMWSHKPGHTEATDKDGDGELIFDPRDAIFRIPQVDADGKLIRWVIYEFTTFYYCPRGGVRTGTLGHLRRRGAIVGV